MSRSSQEGATNQLDLQMQRKGWGYGLDSLDPYIVGVGIRNRAVIVSLRDDAPYYVLVERAIVIVKATTLAFGECHNCLELLLREVIQNRSAVVVVRQPLGNNKEEGFLEDNKEEVGGIIMVIIFGRRNEAMCNLVYAI